MTKVYRFFYNSPPKKTKAPEKKNAISCNNSSARYVI